jgi:ABC-2 type transport system ATP-binding protein
LGPNGAGKTTTISTLLDLIRATSGSVKIFGLDSRNDSLEIRKKIGFLSSDMELDHKLTGWQQLEYFGRLRGSFDKQVIIDLAKRLEFDLNKKFGALSRGNKQKLGLISAMMHRPELLVFDEPTSGLDPIMQAEFNKMILEYRSEGGTVFISSHSLGEVEELCDEVVFIRKGRIMDIKSIDELAKETPKHFEVVGLNDGLKKALKSLAGARIVKLNKNKLQGAFSGDINDLLGLLARHKVEDFSIENSDIEASFMKYYEDSEVETVEVARQKGEK